MSLIATEALIRTLAAEKFRGMAKATVVSDFEPTTDLRVVFDDDTAASHVQSLVGELQAEQRVMVLFTEPHGAYVIDLLHPPAWRPLTLRTGWVALGTVATVVYQPPQIRRVGDRVEVRGEVRRASGADPYIADLPVNFRIPITQGFAGQSAGAFASMYATSGGVLGDHILYNGGGTPSSSVSLSPISFSVTP